MESKPNVYIINLKATTLELFLMFNEKWWKGEEPIISGPIL